MDFSLSEEQIMLRESTRDYARERLAPLAQEAEEQGYTHEEVIKELADLGYFGVCTPPEYGGAGFDSLCLVLAIEEISKVDASIGVMLSVTNSLTQGALIRFGNEDQKKTYLPALASGEKIGAFCLTEANAGSDASAVKTSARREGDMYVLNGTKTFVTNGSIADVFIVIAVTDADAGKNGISVFIVEKGAKGLSVGKKENKMGLRASATTEIVFDGCEVPATNLLGQEGDGLRIAYTLLADSRIGIAAQALGIAEGAFDESVEYANVRVQFGHPISKFEAIQFMLADMRTDIEAARLLTYRAAVLKDSGADVLNEASMAKLFASEASFRCVHKATQIHGGYGYIKEYAVERMYRDQRVTEIYEGTSEVQRKIIANAILKESQK